MNYHLFSLLLFHIPDTAVFCNTYLSTLTTAYFIFADFIAFGLHSKCDSVCFAFMNYICNCSEPPSGSLPVIVQNRESKNLFLLWLAIILWIKMMIFYLYTKLVDNPQPSTFYPLHFRLLRRFWIYLWAFVLSNLILIHRHFAKRISQQIRFFSAFPLQYKHKIPRKEGGLNAS